MIQSQIAELRPEIAEFLAQLGSVRAFSPRTIDAYTFDLSKFCQFADREIGLGWRIDDIGQHSIKAYIQFLIDRGNAAITRGRKLATLKSLFRYLSTQGKVKIDPTTQIKMPKRGNKEPSYLTEEEYKRLLRAVKDSATRYYKERDIAIVTMLIGTGLRLTELVGLNRCDVDLGNGTVKVLLKGGDERMLPMNNSVMTAINRYLKTREGLSASDPLFLSKRERRIDATSVQYMVKKYCRKAHIEKDRLSPHMLRHSFAVALLRQGENVFTVQQLLSHRNIQTTQKYLHLNNDDLKTAVNKIRL